MFTCTLPPPPGAMPSVARHERPVVRPAIPERAFRSVPRSWRRRAPTLQAQECENLMRVVRELAEARSKVSAAKSSLQEKYAELQSDYYRVVRVADLSRTISKENMAKAVQAKKAARLVTRTPPSSPEQQEITGTRDPMSAKKEPSVLIRMPNGGQLRRLDLSDAGMPP
jgi:hypothetical protein